MKIVCESCGAKYSIADERVSGKMFKIRCKRCSEVIIVRGDQLAQPAAEPTATNPERPDPIWHVVVEGEQAGPYSPAQLGEMLTSGSVDWEAYVWTEGFDNWVPMRDVEDLVAQITGQGEAQATNHSAEAHRSASRTLVGQPSMGADPFAEDAAQSDANLFGGAEANAAPDLFARGNPQPAMSAFGNAAEDSGVLSSSPSPRMANERVMTGARNENSVLFSLKNLQALATGSGAPSAPVAAASSERGFAGGEGSGLIDIRALATATGVGDSQAAGQKDELMSIGSHGGAFGTLGSPMLAPSADPGDTKKTVVWAVVAGVGLVSAAFVAATYILRSSPAPATPPVAVAQVSAQPVVVPAAPTPAPNQAVAPTAPLSEGERAAKEAAQRDKERDAEKSSSPRGSGEHHKHSSGSEGSNAKATSNPEPALAETKKLPPKPSGPRSIDDLLDGALSSGTSKAAHEGADSASKANLPDTPSKDQVISAMNAIKPAVQACGRGTGGVATVNVNIAGATGRVTTAEVNGVTGPTGSCIAQAVRKAQFPKFVQKVFKVAFPFKL